MLNKENNPWLGLASYEYEDAYRFFGRKNEIAGLKEAICNNLITTIYGISGAGKTSLINAGMCPLLEDGTYLPIRIRLVHHTDKKYSEQIINAVKDAISKVNGEIEKTSDIETTQASSDGKQTDLIPEQEKLWMFFHTSSFWSKSNHHIHPVIFIDQFEEIFTKNPNTDIIQEFFDGINSLQYDTPPSITATLLEGKDEYIELNYTKDFRFVFIMREDFLARLEDYAYDIPALRKNRLGLKRMNGVEALEVILRPMPEIINKEVALGIISKVSGHPAKDNPSYLEHLSIDTSILSLFCSELYFRAAEQQQEIITLELIEQFGENILFSFYDNTMKLVSPQTMEYLETHLLTRSGFRNSVALEDMLDEGVKKEELDELNSKRLIRIENANGTERVEYTHDVLCAIAKEHRDKRIEASNRKSGLNRNFKFVFDSSITIVLLFLLFVIYYYNRHRVIVEVFSGLCTLYLIGYSFMILPYRFAKDGNAKWLYLISGIINYPVACILLVVADSGNMDSNFILYAVFFLFFVCYPWILFFTSFQYNTRRSFKETLKYIYNFKIYSDYPFFRTVLKYLVLILLLAFGGFFCIVYL